MCLTTNERKVLAKLDGISSGVREGEPNATDNFVDLAAMESIWGQCEKDNTRRAQVLTLVQLSVGWGPGQALVWLKRLIAQAREPHGELVHLSRKESCFNLPKTWSALRGLDSRDAWSDVCRRFLRADLWRERMRQYKIAMDRKPDDYCARRTANLAMFTACNPHLRSRLADRETENEQENFRQEVSTGRNWDLLRNKFGDVILSMIPTGRNVLGGGFCNSA